jgi:hypothetical protein
MSLAGPTFGIPFLARIARCILLASLLLCVVAPARASESPVVLVGADAFSEGMATVMVDGKWGYIDSTGKLVIPTIYDMASGVRRGHATVLSGGELMLIDRNGVRQPDQTALSAAVLFGADSPLLPFLDRSGAAGQEWGYTDREGNVVITPRYAWTGPFSEGRAVISVTDPAIPPLGQGSGYINLQGEIVIAPRYQVASNFSEGLAKVMDQGRHYFIDSTGTRAFDGDFAFAFDFAEGLAAVDTAARDDSLNSIHYGNWGYIDRRGEFAIAAAYLVAFPFIDGVAKVQYQDYQWGLIDKQGRSLTPARYLAIDMFGEGLVGVQVATEQGLKWGFADYAGTLVIPPTFDRVGPFTEGFASVTVDGRKGYIDRRGNYLWEPTR